MCDPRLLELLSSQSVENSEIHAAGTPRISSDTHSVQGEANYQAWTVAAFFFHDRGSEMQKTLVGMLQEILRSILCQVPALITYVMPAFNNLFQTKRKTKPQWDLENLQSALVCIFKQRQVRVRILFLLDALDEHSGDKERLALLLENLVEIADNDFVGLKMCLASRSWNVFEEHFGNCPGFAIHEHTKLDISTYVTSRLRPSTQTFESLAEERSLNALIELLTDKALGVFIWVRLVVDQLVKGIRDGTPFAALEIRARDMPQELKDLYADTLRRIEPEYTTEAYIMLQTALCTSAPLPVKSFMGSVGFNYDYMNQSRRLQVDGPGKRKIEESLPTQLRRLASRSGGLLEVVSIPTLDGAEGNEPDRVVQFIHQTVKEYVQLLQHHAVLREVHPNVLEENGHIFLLRTCVESNESWVCCIKKSLFAHAKHIDDIEADIEKAGVSNTRIPIVAPLLHQIFDSKGDFGMAWWLEERQEPFYEVLKLELEDNRSGAYKNRTTLYRLAVAANLLNFIQNANPQQINKLDLLHIAAAGPDINTSSSKVDICEMVRIVLGRGQLVSQKSLWFEKMFIGALISTQGEPLGCLLVADQVFSGRDEVTRLSIARILLKSGADANGSIYSKTTDDHKVIVMSSLEYCVLFRSASFVRLLLDCGAMFNPERLLGFAYIRQDHDVIRILHQFGLESQIHHSRSLPHVVDAMVPSGEMLAVSSGGVLTALSSIFRKVEADVETNAGSTLIP